MLERAHKILIGSAAGLGVIYGAYSAAHQEWPLVAVAAVATAGLLFYLNWFIRKSR